MKIKQFELENAFAENPFFSHEFWKAICPEYNEYSFANKVHILSYKNLDIETNQLKYIEFYTSKFSAKFVKESGGFRCEALDQTPAAYRTDIRFSLSIRRMVPTSIEDIEVETKRLTGAESGDRSHLPSIYLQMVKYQNIQMSGTLVLI